MQTLMEFAGRSLRKHQHAPTIDQLLGLADATGRPRDPRSRHD